MIVSCPHCRASQDEDSLASDDVVCTSCGATFRPAADATAVWSASDERRELGKFELQQLVGSGSFGSVYRAVDKQLGRTVAVKVPRAGALAGGSDAERFLREARSVAQLRHPTIVSVFEIGREGDLPYLVSEFVDGLTLADLLTGERLTPRVAAEIAADLADALDYAHRQGVVHRDIKPANVMLENIDAKDAARRRYTPRLMDFGLAKRDAGEITMTLEGQVLGTPAYMSPEQARGEARSVDGRSDVYSLGVVLYQMATGELPFKGNARMQFHLLLHDEPPAPRRIAPHVPRDLETICLKAMAKLPARRYATAGEFADDLRRFLAGEPIHARPAGAFERIWRRVRRNPTTAGLVLVVAVLLGVLTYVVARHRRSDAAPPANAVANVETNSNANAGADALLETAAELDRGDPDWRLERIEAKRAFVLDERNSALQVRKARRLFDVAFLEGPDRDRLRELALRRGFFGHLPSLYPELSETEIARLKASQEKARALAAALEKAMDASPESPLSLANAAVLRDALAKVGPALWTLAAAVEKAMENASPEAPLSSANAAALRGILGKIGPALDEARALANFPQGRHPVQWSRSILEMSLPHTDDVRLVARLLDADAALRAYDKRLAEACASCRAALNAGRSMGDEPIAISQLVRLAAVGRGVFALERILTAGGASDADLATLQQLLHDEAEHPAFEIMVRGERGSLHYILSGIEAGDIDLSNTALDFGPQLKKSNPAVAATRAAHVWVLRRLSPLADIAHRPFHEQPALLKRWEADAVSAPAAAQNWIEWLDTQATGVARFGARCLVHRAKLLCAETAVALERYRLKHGAWPKDLRELTPTYMTEIPRDPFADGPLIYRRRPTDAVVYSVGPDGADDGGKLDRNLQPPKGTDAGFRLQRVK